MTTNPPRVDAWLSALQQSQRHLAGIVSVLTPAQVESPSYDSGWTIADVLSHVGSGAEIFSLLLDAGLTGQPAPGTEEFQQVWKRWNARSPWDQSQDALVSDAAFVTKADALDESRRSAWRLTFFGAQQDLEGLIKMRLGEHALHTWDVAVALDPAATVAPESVELIVDNLGQLVARVGKPSDQPLRVQVVTREPARRFVLHLTGAGTQLRPADAATGSEAAAGPGGEPMLTLTAEAFVRLVYGRLDPAHTPPVAADGIDLDVLRATFPGF